MVGANRRAGVKTKLMNTCLYCGAELKGEQTTYCSKNCKKKEYNKRKSERKRKISGQKEDYINNWYKSFK